MCAAIPLDRQPSALEVAKPRGEREVGVHVFPAALVDDLTPHGVTDVPQAIACRCQVAAHAVDAFPEYDLDYVQALVEHDDLERLPGAGDPNARQIAAAPPSVLDEWHRVARVFLLLLDRPLF